MRRSASYIGLMLLPTLFAAAAAYGQVERNGAGGAQGSIGPRQMAADDRPNILLIVADDMGFSDIAPFGSEIATPNLQQLADEGLVLSNFHVHMMCTPTRAMLLSGINNHAAGVGTMAAEQRGAQVGAPGYEAFLRPGIVTIPQLLRESGYRTYISGKWDLGGRSDESLLPQARGFESSFVLVEGSADHFREYPALAELPDINYRLDGEPYTLSQDFYSTEAYTDRMLEFLQSGADSDAPFFAYLAYTAPHYPLQAPDEALKKYAEVYEVGYEGIRSQRLDRQRELGILAATEQAAPPHPAWSRWDSLEASEQAFEARRMQAYAAMIDEMDHHIGRVLDYLRDSGELDRTLVIFLSDNGPEGSNPLDWGEQYVPWAIENFDLSLQNLGRDRSYAWTGPGWAIVSATPFALMKGFPTEGGIRVPAIMRWPSGLARVGIDDEFAHILDLSATLLDLAGASHPGTKNSGFGDRALEGRSMLPYLLGESDVVGDPENDVFVWEILGLGAVRQGDWKLTTVPSPWGEGHMRWALYNLATDPGEQNDLSAERPQVRDRLLAHWRDYVSANGLILLDQPLELPWTMPGSHYEWMPRPVSPDFKD